MKKRREVFAGSDSRRIAASLSCSLDDEESVSPDESGGMADMSQTSMPCASPNFGLKYQCETTPIVWKPAACSRSASMTFCGKYVSKCAPSRKVSLGYLPIIVGPMLLPVYEAIEYACSKTAPLAASASRFGETGRS